jgi:hypothetical protein
MGTKFSIGETKVKYGKDSVTYSKKYSYGGSDIHYKGHGKVGNNSSEVGFSKSFSGSCDASRTKELDKHNLSRVRIHSENLTD